LGFEGSPTWQLFHFHLTNEKLKVLERLWPEQTVAVSSSLPFLSFYDTALASSPISLFSHLVSSDLLIKLSSISVHRVFWGTQVVPKSFFSSGRG